MVRSADNGGFRDADQLELDVDNLRWKSIAMSTASYVQIEHVRCKADVHEPDARLSDLHDAALFQNLAAGRAEACGYSACAWAEAQRGDRGGRSRTPALWSMTYE